MTDRDMAQEEAVALLRRGAEGVIEWNKHREERRILEFHHTGLGTAKPNGPNLSGADLTKAVYRGLRSWPENEGGRRSAKPNPIFRRPSFAEAQPSNGRSS